MKKSKKGFTLIELMIIICIIGIIMAIGMSTCTSINKNNSNHKGQYSQKSDCKCP